MDANTNSSEFGMSGKASCQHLEAWESWGYFSIPPWAGSPQSYGRLREKIGGVWSPLGHCLANLEWASNFFLRLAGLPANLEHKENGYLPILTFTICTLSVSCLCSVGLVISLEGESDGLNFLFPPVVILTCSKHWLGSSFKKVISTHMTPYIVIAWYNVRQLLGLSWWSLL